MTQSKQRTIKLPISNRLLPRLQNGLINICFKRTIYIRERTGKYIKFPVQLCPHSVLYTNYFMLEMHNVGIRE